MRSAILRQVVAVSGTAVLTASLLTIPTASAGANEPTPAASVAEVAGTQESLLPSTSEITEPDNVLLTRISIGPNNPVADALVILRDQAGAVLARTRSGPNGLAALLSDTVLPDRVEVVVRGGDADILEADQIRLRAWHNTRRFDIVHVNAYSTLESACERLASRPACERAMQRFFQLPDGPDYSWAADFSVKGLKGLDVNALAWEIRARDTNLWQHSRKMAREALSGERYTYEREPRQLDAATSDASMSIAPQAMPLPAALLLGFGKILSTGAGARVGGLMADRLLIGLGLMDPPPDNLATREDIEALRRDLMDVKGSLSRVETQLESVRNDLQRLSDVAQQSLYANTRNAFYQQEAALERMSRYFHYMLEYGDCVQSSPQAERCAGRTPLSPPRSGIGLDLCRKPSSADGQWAQAMLAQCAYVMNSIAAYTERYELASATNILAGSGNIPGLIQQGQNAYLAYRANNLLHAGNQEDVRSIGGYWLSQWAYDALAWSMAGEEPRLLPDSLNPSDVQSYAQRARDRVIAAESDSSGAFFGKRLPDACLGNFIVDALTGAPYAIARPDRANETTTQRAMLGQALVVDSVCDGSRAWHGVDPTRADDLTRTANYLARARNVSSAYVGSSSHGSPDGRCFDVNFASVFSNGSGRLAACLRMSLTAKPQVTSLSCTGVYTYRDFGTGRWMGVSIQNWVYTPGRYPSFRSSNIWLSGCERDVPLEGPAFTNQSVCVDGSWTNCRQWRQVSGPLLDRRGNVYGSPQTLLGVLPTPWMSVPRLAAGQTLQVRQSDVFFATRPLSSGETYLPRM